VVRKRGCLAAALLAALLPATAVARPCAVGVGQRVILAATSSDPNVFVWDSREHLVSYAAGRYGRIDAVVRHATLVPPGTRAIVAMCHGGVVRRRYVAQPYDAVGIKVTTGPFRNRWGWVISEDVHVPGT
jgi:hypothetical protein